MTLTPYTFLIVCPMLFAAGFIDAIGGGGGLISLPAYLFAGLPPHAAVATNKLSSSMGATVATIRLCRSGYASFALAVPSVIFAIIGSSIGANVSLLIDEKIMMYIMASLLPVVAFIVLNKRLFKDGSESRQIEIDRKTFAVAIIAAFVVGFYDGFYGPGTGTFLIIAFTVFAGLNIRTANCQAKIINLTTNLTSLAVFLLNGQTIVILGLASGVCNMLGCYLGAGLMLKNGTKIVRPAIFIVLVLLAVKILLPVISRESL